ncbi:MAG: GNAT family N-acetyltransferase, partial [Rhodospirillaceae bacterium]|nr:GNAT family N-acetyltransferase [Rhodospirillaceae bacterium]
MHVDVFEGRQALADLRRDWEAVYEADPEASFFLSWTWLSGWIQGVDKPCLVLAAKPHPRAKAHVAFLPLAVWTKHTKAGFSSALAMAGNRMADYTGIIAVPEFLPQAIAAFAAHLKRLDWTDLNLENLRVSEADLARLLQHFPAKAFEVKHTRTRIDPRDNINHSVCPYVVLPEDWDRYLESIGPNSRQKARRFLRKVDAGALSITHADAATIDADLDTLLRFWSIKWGSRKGPRLPGIVRMHRTMLKHCFASGCLFMPVLWQDERPLGALAILVDRPKRSLLFFIGARDETVSNPPPGFVLHAYAIRYAIANGFAVYDFLRGNEPYKYLFASQERSIRHVVVTARDDRPRLDRRS